MKRAFDLIGAIAGVAVLFPIMLIVAALIRWDSPGPIVFRQWRVGRALRPFRIYKFRTMHARRGARITTAGDARITRIGHLLRQTKLDELPQLINVIKGDMSLVGPRPEVPRYVALYQDEYREILRVRPGITDPASIKFRHEAEILAQSPDPETTYITRILPEKIALAKDYVQHASLLLDVRVIWWTLLSIGARHESHS